MRAHLALAVLAVLAACDAPPVAWTDPVVVPATAGVGRLVVTPRGQWRFDPTPTLDPARLPADPAMCPGSASAVRRDDGGLVAVWWSARREGGVLLEAAVSGDGGATWDRRPPLDTTDAGDSGCQRPAPAAAASGENVHVVYAMRGREGTGVFFVHSMNRGQAWEPPRPVIYGERLVETAIAADGDRVVVAYVDPSAAMPQVALAISRTMGHIFEDRTLASTGTGAASAPGVALADHAIAASWRLQAADSSSAVRMVRTGRLR